ncbi:sensor histidine kinase [Colwellia sp. 12G3]|uniref:sensor histidine kinase n=1 Tax=Colwellia sp. 12G3 TaxID=2058299 RepID=UPI000C31DABF|nr:ATP-binding protein [Colwellia sp. 12G3]PKI18157.1 two-component sensor histidine kinase [Colwellia sp. 12G3]
MKKISISFALARFVFLSCFALALISTVLVINYAVDSAQRQQEQLIKRETTAITHGYRLFLKHRLTLLADQAKNPIMVQALMQPEANIGKLQDFMADLTILGHQYQQNLLDFEGNVIYSKQDKKAPDYHNEPWLKDIINDEAPNHIAILKLNDNYFWCLAVIIMYNNNFEGVLTTLIPIEDIDEQDEKLDSLMIKITRNGEELSSFGQERHGKQHSVYWPNIGVVFSFTFDDSANNEELNDAIIKLSTLILLALIATSLLAYVFGYRYFVKPLLLLSQATSKLHKGSEFELLQDNITIKELSELFQKFNVMTNKVHQRESSLKLSYDKLSKVNDELILSESQLIQSEKMASIGVLAAGVAHEINNPLGFVKSNLDVLNEYLTDIQKYHQEINEHLTTEASKEWHVALTKKYDIEFIFEDMPALLTSSIGGVEKITEIVQSLKTFARIEESTKSKTDINEGLTATLNMVNNELKYNCEVHVELDPLPIIYAYPSKLNQVFMNLLINAGQSITGSGEIFVRTFQKETDIVIEIKDNGSGIAPGVLPHIFTPFFTSKPVGQGTGLGLSISHGIIKQHDGRIEVTSEEGKGSCFSVYIPTNLSKKTKYSSNKIESVKNNF